MSLDLQKNLENQNQNESSIKNLLRRSNTIESLASITSETMDTSDVVTDAMTAVTPPALLSHAEDYIAEQQTVKDDEVNKKRTFESRKGSSGNSSWPFVSYF